MALHSITPEPYSTITANDTITVTFDLDPGEVITSMGVVSGSGKVRTITGPFPSGNITLLIQWADGRFGFDYEVIHPPSEDMDDSLILYLSFDELSSNSVIDHSSHENHGTLVGTPQLVNGRFGKALRFNGESDWVEVPHDDSLTVDENVTVMAWIHTPRHHGPAGALWQAIIAKGNNPRSYSVYTEHNGALHMSVGNFQGSDSTETVQLNTWQHVVTQIDNGMQRFWINGENAGNFPIAASLPGLVDNSSVRIGNSHDTAPAHAWMRHFLGIIDEVRVWNRALSEAEIREKMQMGLNTITQ